MDKEEQLRGFKRSCIINFRCSIIAMIMTQAILFSFEMSVWGNITAYILNIIAWAVVLIVLKILTALYYRINLTEEEVQRKG